MSTTEWLASAAVAEEVFALRPDYCVVLLVVDGLHGGPSDEASEILLVQAEHAAAELLRSTPPEQVPHVAQWRDAYRAFGAKPQRTRPSVEALLRRAGSGLPRIDRITDIYNAMSVLHTVPIGGEDRTCYIGTAQLVRADGTERFETTMDGRQDLEHPDQGEVIWRDDLGVTCRRWNWRQCTRTRITEATTSAVFVLDGLDPLGPDGLTAAADALHTALLMTSPQAVFSRRLIAAPAHR